MDSKPTKRMIEFLQWMDTQGSVALFPSEWVAIRRKAERDGLIAPCGREGPGVFALLKYQLTTDGREALKA